MFGTWLCWEPNTTLDDVFDYNFTPVTTTDCMRFLPGDDYSNTKDYGFQQGDDIKVMTYLTSRTYLTEEDGNLDGKKSLKTNAKDQVFETYTVELFSGAWSGISVTGLALATICATYAF